MRRNWLMLALIGLMAVGCRSTSTTRKGVTSVETAGAKRESMLETVAKAPIDKNPVVPASFTSKESGGECKH